MSKAYGDRVFYSLLAPIKATLNITPGVNFMYLNENNVKIAGRLKSIIIKIGNFCWNLGGCVYRAQYNEHHIAKAFTSTTYSRCKSTDLLKKKQVAKFSLGICRVGI